MIGYTNRGDINIADVVHAILIRAHNHSWVVALKALICAHTLFRGGHKRFIQYFATCASVFNLDSYMDSRDLAMSAIVRRYGRCLNERLVAFRALGADPAGIHSKESFESIQRQDPPELFTNVKSLLRMLESLLGFFAAGTEVPSGTGERDVLVRNVIVELASGLVVKDLLLVYRIANNGMTNILERFFNLPLAQAQEALPIFRRFVELCTGLDNALGIANAVGLMDGRAMPSLAAAPSELLPALQTHLDALRHQPRTVSATAAAIAMPDLAAIPVAEPVRTGSLRVASQGSSLTPAPAPAAAASSPGSARRTSGAGTRGPNPFPAAGIYVDEDDYLDM